MLWRVRRGPRKKLKFKTKNKCTEGTLKEKPKSRKYSRGRRYHGRLGRSEL